MCNSVNNNNNNSCCYYHIFSITYAVPIVFKAVLGSTFPLVFPPPLPLLFVPFKPAEEELVLLTPAAAVVVALPPTAGTLPPDLLLRALRKVSRNYSILTQQ